eukprot:172095-Pleurochrysis_carterae.AAC.1
MRYPSGRAILGNVAMYRSLTLTCILFQIAFASHAYWRSVPAPLPNFWIPLLRMAAVAGEHPGPGATSLACPGPATEQAP